MSLWQVLLIIFGGGFFLVFVALVLLALGINDLLSSIIPSHLPMRPVAWYRNKQYKRWEKKNAKK